jgi:hypothetical protein
VIDLFVKIFAITLSVLYILYAIIVERQTRVMNRTVQSSAGPLITSISLIQVMAAIVLLIISIVLL